MLSLTVHLVQVLGEWAVSATLVRDAGAGLEPEVCWDRSTLPLTGDEWDADDLTAVLSALARWSGRTSEGKRLQD
jgi:hypothetical protein